MEDFQKSLLKLMTSSLTESERIQLIAQLQFAIVLLQKQQQQFEEKRENERNLQIAELNNRANGFNTGPQQQNHQYSQSECQTNNSINISFQKHQYQQTDDILDQPNTSHQFQHQRQIQYQHQQIQQNGQQLSHQNQQGQQENQPHQMHQSQQTIQQHISTSISQQNPCSQSNESQSIIAPQTPIMRAPIIDHHPQKHETQSDLRVPSSCDPSDCMDMLSAPPSIGSTDQHHLNLHLKEVQKHQSDGIDIKCSSTLEEVLSSPPHHLLQLQQRDEGASAFDYFHGEPDDCAENQAFTNEAGANDLDNFDQPAEHWSTPHKHELHETGVQETTIIPFCQSEIEVVQLTTSGSKPGGSPPNSRNVQDVEGSDGNSGDGRMLLPSLYSSGPTLTSFSDSPRDTEDDPLLAPITLEGEIAMRDDSAEAELADHDGDGSEFPALRVSFGSRRKARKPRRMTPEEEIEEDELLSPYHVCPICDLVWRRTNDYVCHLIGHAPSPVTCAQCKGTFDNEALLRSHECFDPNQSLYFRRLCGYCDACFVNKKAFNRHKRTTHAFATSITCNFCQQNFYTSKSYYQHLEASHITKGWRVCQKCGQVVENDAALRQHMKKSHSRNASTTHSKSETIDPSIRNTRARRLPYKCSYCSPKHAGDKVECFATRAELREHVNKAHQIRCDDCGKSFPTAPALQKHRQVSHCEPPVPKRRRIGKSMPTPEPPPKDGIRTEMELAQQVLDQDDEEDLILTEEEDDDDDSVLFRTSERGSRSRQSRPKRLASNSTSSSKSTNQRRAAQSKARARRQCNPQLNGYKCRFCPTRFSSFSVYREHLQLNHADQVKAAECKDCQQVFLSQSSLEKHRLTRTHLQKTGAVKLERRHLCEICGKAYLRHQVLQRHMKTHINDYEFCCPHCEFKAVEKSNLKAHLSRHFNIKPFSCDKCDAKFTSRRSLNDHCKFKHSDSRDYFCDLCGMGFKTPGTLSRHKKGHSTEKPFVCFCGVQFNRLSNLRRHLKSVHQTDDTVLPVKRLKKFTSNGNVSYGNSTPQPEPQIQQQAQPPEQLMSIHLASEPSPPPASVMHNLQPLPASPPTEDSNPQAEAPRTPQLPEENDEDSTHAVLHSFLNSTSDQPHINSASSADPSSSLLVHQTPPNFCQPSVSDVTVSTVASTASTGPMLRSLVGVGDPVQTVPPGNHIWRPMGSESTPCVTPTSGGGSDVNQSACTIVSSVNCVLDSTANSSGNALPFDDVLWSSAVLPQTSGVPGPNGNASITYLFSGGANSNVSLVGQSSETSPMLFTPGGMNGTASGLVGPVASSNGELTSTLMISHLTSDPLGLHGLSGSLVSPTLQSNLNGVGISSSAGHLGGDHQHGMHHHVSHPHQQHPIQQPVPATGHQCSDFSVCYLIGGQSHVK